MHYTDDARDEQFCLAFELGALSDLLIRKETERWVSGFANQDVEVEHTNRYKWVSQFIAGKTVLDIACGSGRGSYIMATEGQAKEVVGCDIDSKAIRYASLRNKRDNVSFLANDAQQFDDGMTYDVIVSFETIEHIPDVEAFLATIQRSLSAKGHFYVSTPISSQELDTKPANRYHLREWGFRGFQEHLANQFLVEDVYVQLRQQQVDLPNIPFLRKAVRLYNSLLHKSRVADSHSYNMKPVEFNSKRFPINKLGKTYNGYQILKCCKRP